MKLCVLKNTDENGAPILNNPVLLPAFQTWPQILFQRENMGLMEAIRVAKEYPWAVPRRIIEETKATMGGEYQSPEQKGEE